MTGDCHVRFCERLGVKLPLPTRLADVNIKMTKYFQILIFLLHGFGLSAMGQESFYLNLADSALSLTLNKVTYDPSYFSIKYPNGDIPGDKGVCTDVIIRAYRKMEIDLQKEVHLDMKDNFNLYPKIWGLTSPDKNIDHRRVPNLMKFFERHGEVKAISNDPDFYLPGDIVCWNLGGGITHIGIVSNIISTYGNRFKIVHNIGAGQVLEDILFDFEIIGHYRYKK